MIFDMILQGGYKASSKNIVVIFMKITHLMYTFKKKKSKKLKVFKTKVTILLVLFLNVDSKYLQQ